MANEKLSKELVIKLWNKSTNEWDAIARTTSYSLEINKETVDVTSFDSNGWKEFKVDLKEASLSGDALVVRESHASEEVNYQELLESLVGSDELFAIQTINPETELLDGTESQPTSANSYKHELITGYLTGLSLSGSLGDKQTFSWTIQPTGEVVIIEAVYAELLDATANVASYAEGDIILVLDQVADTDTGYMIKDTGAWVDYGVFSGSTPSEDE
jgi:predicted secreted protein